MILITIMITMWCGIWLNNLFHSKKQKPLKQKTFYEKEWEKLFVEIFKKRKVKIKDKYDDVE